MQMLFHVHSLIIRVISSLDAIIDYNWYGFFSVLEPERYLQ